jgi:flagellar basal body-associated protein FliL
MNKITDERRIDVEKEFNKLNTELMPIIKQVQFYYNALKIINTSIWEDQDNFRYSSNDEEKNNLCKKIIDDNDARFRIKNKINNILNSFLKEQKGYIPKVYTINYSSNDIKMLNSLIKYKSIFNDQVIVHCTSKQYDNLYNTFKSDASISILPDLSDCSIEALDTSFEKNVLFNYIYNTL